VKRFIIGMSAAALCALSLAGCIDSSGPILADSQQVFGPKLRLQGFTLRSGYAHDPAQVNFNWNGALYARAGGTGARDVSAFSVHPFEAGDYILQVIPERQARITQFALLHKLGEGVYQVLPIDEADADEPTRVAFCKKADKSPCRIETREQLFAFARATAAQRKDDGGLVLRLPDGSEKTERPARRAPPPRR
jgi:hypothetical protein